MGYETQRYSGAAFKVKVAEADGSIRGLDVFGGFLRDGHALPDGRDPHAVPRGVGLPARPRPARGPVVPGAGRPRPPARRDLRQAVAHARPGVPLRDARRRPTAVSTAGSVASAPTVRCGTAPTATGPRPPSWEPSDLARDAFARARRPTRRTSTSAVVSGWTLAGSATRAPPRGVSTTSPRPTGSPPRRPRQAGRTRYRYLNLLELRSVLSTGALVARSTGAAGPARPSPRRRPDPRRPAEPLPVRRHDPARRAATCTWSSCRVAATTGYAARHHLRSRHPQRIAAELERAGATIRHRSILLASGPEAGREADVVPSRICRMVASWDR